MSNSLRLHELQHAWLLCPPLSPGVCSDSCPLSQWCYLTILSSATPLLFQWVRSLKKVAKILELQLQHQSFQWIFRVDFCYDWLVGSPCDPRDSQESSPALQFESINMRLRSIWKIAVFHPDADLFSPSCTGCCRFNFSQSLYLEFCIWHYEFS